MATVIVTLTDAFMPDGETAAVNMHLDWNTTNDAPDGPVSRALLAAHWFKMHFETGKVDCDLAMRNLKGQYVLREAVRAATQNQGANNAEVADPGRPATPEEEEAILKQIEAEVDEQILRPDQGSPTG